MANTTTVHTADTTHDVFFAHATLTPSEARVSDLETAQRVDTSAV